MGAHDCHCLLSNLPRRPRPRARPMLPIIVFQHESPGGARGTQYRSARPGTNNKRRPQWQQRVGQAGGQRGRAAGSPTPLWCAAGGCPFMTTEGGGTTAPFPLTLTREPAACGWPWPRHRRRAATAGGYRLNARGPRDADPHRGAGPPALPALGDHRRRRPSSTVQSQSLNVGSTAERAAQTVR